VTLVEGAVFTPALTKQLTTMIREQIAPFAAPDFIQDAPGLPKTRR
jgi:acetyl-CoA synthetase